MSPLESLKLIIEINFEDFSVSDPIDGTYGNVWILSKNGKREIALKTIMPSSYEELASSDFEIFERELNKSLTLPSHFNVITTYGFVEPKLFFIREDAESSKKSEPVYISILKMKAMKGSLQEWVEKPSYASEKNRIIAMLQAASGFRHMYESGFEGHGDIKPSNILFSDLREEWNLSQPKIIDEHPFKVVISDYGWADAWVDYKGLTNKALRQYMAPERFGGSFIPIKSDIFSIGIVLAEIIQCRHPAKNINKYLQSEGKAKKIIENKDWDLSGIESKKIKDLVFACLNLNPEERPSIDELITALKLELKVNYKLDNYLDYLNTCQETYKENKNERLGWASQSTTKLSEKERNRTLIDLKSAIQKINVIDFVHLEEWSFLSSKYINSANAEDKFSSSIKSFAREYLEDILYQIKNTELEELTHKNTNDYVENFEIFTNQISLLSKLANTNYESEKTNSRVTPLALAALAFSVASEMRRGGDMCKANLYLQKSIEHDPNQAVIYYFDALWNHMHEMMMGLIKTEFTPYTKDEKLIRIEKAIELAPNWSDPKKLLTKI